MLVGEAERSPPAALVVMGSAIDLAFLLGPARRASASCRDGLEIANGEASRARLV